MLDDLETGRRREALDLANDYLGRRAAWQTHDLGIEPSLSVQWVRLAAGGIDQATFATLRDRWLQQERARSERGALASSGYEGMRWSAAYASVVVTPTDAASALLARPDIHPLIDALGSTPHYTEPIGRTYALAGKVDEAIAILSKVRSVVRGHRYLRAHLLYVGRVRPRAGARGARRCDRRLRVVPSRPPAVGRGEAPVADCGEGSGAGARASVRYGVSSRLTGRPWCCRRTRTRSSAAPRGAPSADPSESCRTCAPSRARARGAPS